MPELPEVETTRRGIVPHIAGHRIERITVRQHRLRWPIPRNLETVLPGQSVHQVTRRAKYLLFHMDRGTLIVHLGMSGSLRIVQSGAAAGKHDHVDLAFSNERVLRLSDPRRFGAVLWSEEPPERHPLLAGLGPEPLSGDFDGEYLYQRARNRKMPVKQFLMDGKIVVGVGNIYANEALFMAGIAPRRAAGRVSATRFEQLSRAVKAVLQAAIEQGGTTLRDFVGGDGRPGYFAQQLRVYGRSGEECAVCGQPIRQIRLGQRSTFYCGSCQR